MSNGNVSLVQTGKAIDVPFMLGMTINQVIASQEWELGEQNEVRLNGAKCTDMDTTVKAGDMVMVIGEISGG